jgi:DNA polymerase V
MFALVDCNNFYASCERVFNPPLIGKPIVVLSNNDGCAVARSNEAKELGVKMGVPLFEIKELVKKHQIHVFSSNYELYGSLSNRVMNILSTFSPQIEIYITRLDHLLDYQPLFLFCRHRFFNFHRVHFVKCQSV